MIKTVISLIFLGLSQVCAVCFAQSSFGLGEINPWGTNYLKGGEPSFPTSAWQNSDIATLEKLLNGVQPQNLTPLQRDLLRRALLSPARAPAEEGAKELLALRAKLIYELGEANAAADLMGRIDTLPDRLNPEHLEADLMMALGQESGVCSSLINTPREGSFWVRTRAVCALLTGDTSLAELTLEFANMQGVIDSWLMQAVVYQASPENSPAPTARFDSGVNLALSLYLNLPTPLNAVSSRRKELAAILAARRSIPSDVRTSAANIAFAANLITAEDYVSAYAELAKDLLASKRALNADQAIQSGQSEALLNPPPQEKNVKSLYPRNATEKALLLISDKGANRSDKIEVVMDALRRAKGDFTAYKLTASLFDSFIRSIQPNEIDTGQFIDLARASLVLGDTQTTRRLLSAEAQDRKDKIRQSQTITVNNLSDVVRVVSPSGQILPPNPAKPQPQPPQPPQIPPHLQKHLDARAFENARLQAVMQLEQGSSNVPSALAKDVIALAKSPAQKKAAGQVLLLWQMLGLELPIEALPLIASIPHKPLQPAQTVQILALSNSLQRQAMAEAALRIQDMLKTKPANLHPLVLGTVYDALSEINSQDVGEDLLLQASNFWKEAG